MRPFSKRLHSHAHTHTIKHTHARTHTHAHTRVFAAAGDSFLIFHSNSCGLALILASRGPGLKGWLTLRVCLCMCVCACVCACVCLSSRVLFIKPYVWHDNWLLCWTEWVVCLTGHNMTEADTHDRLTDRSHNTETLDTADWGGGGGGGGGGADRGQAHLVLTLLPFLMF